MTNSGKKSGSNLGKDLFAISLDPAARASLQSQLLRALRRLTVSEPDRAGAKLPASRVLAAELSISRTTVQAVYDQMISEGYLVARQGSGTFVAQDVTHLSPPEPIQRPNRPGPRPWRVFQIGLPDQTLLPHRAWARHLERAWRMPDPGLLARSDPLGWYPLREAIADHLAAWRHLSCDPEQVVITSGAWDSLEVIFRGLVGHVSHVAVEDPCWPKTHEVLARLGTTPDPVRIDAEGLDPGRIPKRSAAVIVTPSRHYPTGLNLPMPRRVALLDWARRTGGLVIEDDYDSEFRYRGQPLPSLSGLDGLEHTLYLGSFSKLISAALRIGYLVVPKHLVGATRDYLERIVSRASLVPQPALASFMQSGEFATHLRRMRRIYARRRSHLLDRLEPFSDLLELNQDASGMHLCTPLSPSLTARTTDHQISRNALAVGLQVGAVSDHSVLPDPAQGLLLGFAAFDEDRLSEAVERLGPVLRG